jgi:hypothetical protein
MELNSGNFMVIFLCCELGTAIPQTSKRIGEKEKRNESLLPLKAFEM